MGHGAVDGSVLCPLGRRQTRKAREDRADGHARAHSQCMATMSQTLLQQFQGPVTSTLHGARVHYWPSPTPKPTASLLFIPGNPGLSDYYIAYLTALHRTVNSGGPSSLEIFCPSQLGHDPLASVFPETLVSLDEQVTHKAAVLATVSTRWSGDRPRIILAGHSIGAWMALEIVRRGLNRTPVYSIHLLFPALHQMGQTPNARKLAWLFRASDSRQHQASSMLFLPLLTALYALLSVALRVVQILPIPVVHFLVLLGAPTQPPSAVRTTTNFVLSPPCVKQALYMANDEMMLVRQLQDLPASSTAEAEVDVRMRAYWAAGDIDGWAPDKTRKVVERTLGMQSYELPQDIVDKSSPIAPLQRSIRKQKSYSIDEIRKARSSKRRALAGMVRAGASASYGLASSLGTLGYRRGQAPSQSGGSSSGVGEEGQRRFVRRRPSLMAARASRRFDGTIMIEPAEGNDSNDDLLSKDNDEIDGIVFESPSVERSQEVLSEGEKAQLRMPSRASIVCRNGFKHAFVLEHSEQMASISAAMVLADMAV